MGGVGFRLPTLRGLLFAITLPAAVAGASFAIALALGVVSLSRLLVVPMVMITITAAGTSYAWLRWSTGSIGTVSTMHAAFNESMQRWSAATVATSPAALAYTTTETGLVTMLLMIILAGYLLTRQAAVFRAGAQESRALFVPRVAGDHAGFVGEHP